MSNFENIWDDISHLLPELDYRIIKTGDNRINIEVGFTINGVFYQDVIQIGDYLLTITKNIKSKSNVNLDERREEVYQIIGTYLAYYKFHTPLIKDQKGYYDLTNVSSNVESAVGGNGFLSQSALFKGNGVLKNITMPNSANRSYSFFLYPANYEKLSESDPSELKQNSAILFISNESEGLPHRQDLIKLNDIGYRGCIEVEQDGGVPVRKYINYRKWYHIVTIYEGNTVKLYIDNILIGSALTTVRNMTYNRLCIGKEVTIPNAGFLKGRIENLHVFNKVITTNEILYLNTIYKPAWNICIDDYLVYYRCHGNTLDETRNYNTSYYNATGYNIELTEDCNGYNDRAYEFNGIDSKIESDANFPPYSNGTISVWVYLYNPKTQWCGIAVKGLNAMILYDNGKIVISSTSGVRQAISSGLTNEWNNIAVTVENGVYRCFINNIEAEYTTGANMPIISSKIQIGSLDGAYFFRGDLTKVRVYNKVLNGGERYWLYQEELQEPFHPVKEEFTYTDFALSDENLNVLKLIPEKVDIDEEFTYTDFALNTEIALPIKLIPEKVDVEEEFTYTDFTLSTETPVAQKINILPIVIDEEFNYNDFTLVEELFDYEII